MSPSPRLTIVTITCRDASGLRLTLHSLRPLREAWPELAWEHVVVDGSPELNRAALAALPAGWPLVHVEQPPGGVPHAFNQALAVARGAHLWFLNGGDALHDLAALARLLERLDADGAADFVCGAAYLHRRGVPLYPVAPWPTFLGNLLGRNWIYHQAVIYRRTALTRVGPYSTAYRAAGDYDHHLRGYIAGLRGRFTGDVLVDYDMEGGSSDVVTVFAEFERIQRSYRGELPPWVNWGNEIVRRGERARILAQRRLSATRLGARLRRPWAKLNRWLRHGGHSVP